VTSNLADFVPMSFLLSSSETVHRDDFLLDQLKVSPVIVRNAARKQAGAFEGTLADRSRPPPAPRQGRCLDLCPRALGPIRGPVGSGGSRPPCPQISPSDD